MSELKESLELAAALGSVGEVLSAVFADGKFSPWDDLPKLGALGGPLARAKEGLEKVPAEFDNMDLAAARAFGAALADGVYKLVQGLEKALPKL